MPLRVQRETREEALTASQAALDVIAESLITTRPCIAHTRRCLDLTREALAREGERAARAWHPVLAREEYPPGCTDGLDP